jgi:gliding motility-associated-like protein
MRFLKKIVFLFFLFVVPNTILAQYITVNDSYTAQQLVNTLVNSSCATLSNFSATSGNFNSTQKSFGYFTSGTSGFPLANGIVLSTCRATSTQGPNNSTLSEDATGWGGDTDLEQALSISGTSNATILEFDFIPYTNFISFDYIFASEEYHGNSPCNYSDGFAFLLKKVGDPTYQNLALVPGTSTPVKVTTVHPDIPGGCGPQNATYFGGYNPAATPINFNGQTVIMTASANVVAGVTYHIKMVIADETNPQYDSAIFLGGGSFNSGKDLGPDRLIATNNPICDGQTLTLDATSIGTNTYKWFKNGIDIGVSTPTYTVTAPGTYKVEIVINGICTATGEIVVEYTPLPTLNNQILYQCDDNGDGISTFNLTKVSNLITGGNASLSAVTYYPSLANAQNQINAIATPTAFLNTTTNTVYGRVTNQYGCANYALVQLMIANNTITPQPPVITCDMDTADGIYHFDLNTISTAVLTGLPTGMVVEYYASITDAVLQSNPLATPFTNTVASTQIIYARIVNGPDCYGIIPITLKVDYFNPIAFADETFHICQEQATTIGVPSGYASYLWNTGATTNSIVAPTSGSYSVVTTNSNGCTKTTNFNIIVSGVATIVSIDYVNFSDANDSFTIIVTGSSEYQFSLDGIHYQDSPTFTHLFPDEYTVYVRDKNGCGVVMTTAYLLDYPKYFTPNGDGYNDTWTIKNLQRQGNATITIYDRFGQLLYQFKQSQAGWNGTFNGNELPSTDYWFTLKLNNGEMVKGHFALKR